MAGLIWINFKNKFIKMNVLILRVLSDMLIFPLSLKKIKRTLTRKSSPNFFRCKRDIISISQNFTNVVERRVGDRVVRCEWGNYSSRICHRRVIVHKQEMPWVNNKIISERHIKFHSDLSKELKRNIRVKTGVHKLFIWAT